MSSFVENEKINIDKNALLVQIHENSNILCICIFTTAYLKKYRIVADVNTDAKLSPSTHVFCQAMCVCVFACTVCM
jgi:hypothetical protein